MRVEIGLQVGPDLDVVAAYIARDNPGRAISFVEELRGEFRVIGRNPAGFRLRPHLGKGARMAVKGRYVILFLIQEDFVEIRRVFHGARNLKRVLRETGGL